MLILSAFFVLKQIRLTKIIFPYLINTRFMIDRLEQLTVKTYQSENVELC